MLQTQHYTLADFEAFIRQPENQDRDFEFIGGRIVEVVSNNYSSEVAMRIGGMIVAFVLPRKLGHVTGADGGYIVMDERYIPDVGFIRIEKQPESSHAAYNPNPPDLAVEVLSPTNNASDMRIKIVNYLRAGTTDWLVDPEKKQVEIYQPDTSPVTLGLADTLDGDALLPGFTLAIKLIFE